MPYGSNKELPLGVRDNLPPHAQDIYREAFNNALDQYKDPAKRQDKRESLEEVCHRVAWGAVKNVYTKNDKGHWVKKRTMIC